MPSDEPLLTAIFFLYLCHPPFFRLLHDRELSLYDGTRLLRWDRYQALKEEVQLSDEELQQRFAIHLLQNELTDLKMF